MHVPFCAAKCHYCDFYSFAAESRDAEGFVELLLTEVRARAGPAPRTVFVGGGTPSWLPAADLRSLFDGLDRATGFRESAVEVTVECNPESLDADKARLLVELGATRLSIGAQSLRPELLERFGRVHEVADTFRAVDAARAAGEPDVSVDLIYGSPGEKLATWRDDLARILELGLQHVSAYNLAYEPGTAFHRWRAQGKLQPLDEELELAFFWQTRDQLSAAGLAPYETSNFSLNGYQCRHNLAYWRNEPYCGVGPSAVSKTGHVRSGNPRSLDAWRRGVEAGEGPEWTDELDARARLGETWWLGLRTSEGVDPARARATADFAGDGDPCEREAERWVDEGLLELADASFRLTRRGLPLADAIAERFLVAGDEASAPHG